MTPFPATGFLPASFESIRDKIKLVTFETGQEWVNIIDPSFKECGAAFGVEVGQQDEMEGGYYNGVAHLLEHSIFLGETPQMRQLFTNWNAYTATQETAFLFSSSAEQFVKAFTEKIEMLYNFKKYPNIKDEVSAVNNE